MNPFIIDSILFVKELAVAKTRRRFMKSIIESSSQSAFMKKTEKNIESVNMPQKKIFIQRDSFRFEIIEDIVSEKKMIFIRNRVADRDERARSRNRSRNRSRSRSRSRNRNRGRDRNKKRGDSRRAADEAINETANQEADEMTNEMADEMADEMTNEIMND